VIRTPEAHRSGHIPHSRLLGRMLYRMRSVVFALLLAIVCVCPMAFFTPARALASASSENSIYFGLVYPGAPDISILLTKEAQLQHGMSLVLWYQDWVMNGQQEAFPTSQMDAVRAHGSIPVLAWYPMDGTVNSPTQPKFTLTAIINGTWDAYIRQYAAQVKAWGHPFFLRFASEMNGSWIPWSEMSNGNQRGQFVQAWRHVHDIFTQVGVKNATWTWCPNTEDATTTPLEDLYPGSAYVDWACMDGYNFAVDLGGSPWRSFSQIFRGTYQHILALIPPTMPIMIGEMASSEHGGSKPNWIKDGLSVQLPGQFPRVKGVIWFDSTNPGLDLRIDTSPQSLAALSTSLASGAYTDNSYRFLDQSPIPAPGGVGTKPSRPPIFHNASGPAAGYVQVLDSTQNAPVPNAKLVYGDGTSPATDAQGLVAMQGNGQQVILNAISLRGGAVAVALLLDRSSGYQIQIDQKAGEVISVRVHDPPPQPPPPKPRSLASTVVTALKAAPRSLVAMIALAALTLLIAVMLALRSGIALWRHYLRTRRQKMAAEVKTRTRKPALRRGSRTA